MAKLLELRRGTTAENDLFTGALAEPTYDTDRKEIRVHDGSTQGGKIVSVPVGVISEFGSTTAPAGWLACDGSAVSRTDYADLFAVIGTNYGDGDGNTTFNLPDRSDVILVSSSSAPILNSSNNTVSIGYGASGNMGYIKLSDNSGKYTEIHCENGSHSGNWTSSSGAYTTFNLHANISSKTAYFYIKY